LEKEIKSWIKTISFSIIAAVVILQFFSFFLVSGLSMLPTLDNNDYLIVKKPFLGYFEYQRNDIIVFKTDIKSEIRGSRELVKRIIAVEGDHIEIINDIVYINDKELEEEYILENKTKGNIDILIDKNCFFVMGDNRKVSLDSRSENLGVIDEDGIIGKVIVKMFPVERIGDENDEN
jgi:signal peptidase I